MNNQVKKHGDIIADGIPGHVQKLYKNINVVYPDDCLDGTFEIEEAFYVDDLYLGRGKDSLQSTNSEARYVVTRNYEVKYQIKGKNGQSSIIVPAGMLTDLASVKKVGRALIGRVGKHLEAAIVHDWLYMA